jgi:hypothetical protein
MAKAIVGPGGGRVGPGGGLVGPGPAPSAIALTPSPVAILLVLPAPTLSLQALVLLTPDPVAIAIVIPAPTFDRAIGLTPDPVVIILVIPGPAAIERVGRTGLTIEIMGRDVVAAAEWKSFRYTEQIGQPDTLSVDVLGFTTDPGITAPVVYAFTYLNNYFWTIARLGDAVLFSGLIRPITMTKPAVGAIRYSLKADGWQFLMPRRLVGVPNGDGWIITEDGDPDRIPTPVVTDTSAYGYPTPVHVARLMAHYWNSPWPIDVTTFVTPILEGAPSERIAWSGSDLEGTVSDLAAAGNAAALWWFANDSPNLGSIVSPHLALHWGLVVVPAEGDPPPANAAPYAISDTPDWVTSILAVSLEFSPDNTPRVDAVYVRGATGYTMDVVDGVPTGVVNEGGTGWVGSTGGIWGEEYVDAPAAISAGQRNAFGNATLASRSAPTWTGTIVVNGYDGWHKGQVVSVTDADYGFDARWFLIRAVTMSQKDPQSLANEYTLTVGDSLSPSLGSALRSRRLKEQRQEIAPATKFVPYVGDLQLDSGGSCPVTMQLATDAGAARQIAGVGARWHLLVNGVDLADPLSAAELYWLTSPTLITNEVGQVTATLHASLSATAADAANPWAEVVV